MNNTLFDEKIKELQNLYVEDIFKEIENMFIKEGLQDHFTKIEYNQVILNAMKHEFFVN